MSRFALIVRWIVVHPVISLVIVVAVISGGAVLFSGGGSDDPAPVDEPDIVAPEPGGDPGSDPDLSPGPGQKEKPKKKKKKAPKKTADHPDAPAPDPHDYDPDTIATVEKQLREQPAVQHLPLDLPGIYADLENVLPDDRLLIRVIYSGSKARAERTWVSFLKRHKDSGRAYIVIYKKG